MTFDDVLENCLVTVVSRDDKKGIFKIKIGTLDTTITIKVNQRKSVNRQYLYHVSHGIQTPIQHGPYFSSVCWGPTRPLSLHKAIEDFLVYYKKAIKDNYDPESEWLVASK